MKTAFWTIFDSFTGEIEDFLDIVPNSFTEFEQFSEYLSNNTKINEKDCIAIKTATEELKMLITKIVDHYELKEASKKDHRAKIIFITLLDTYTYTLLSNLGSSVNKIFDKHQLYSILKKYDIDQVISFESLLVQIYIKCNRIQNQFKSINDRDGFVPTSFNVG